MPLHVNYRGLAAGATNPALHDVRETLDNFGAVEEQEDAEDLAAYDAAVADPDPGIPLNEIDWKEE